MKRCAQRLYDVQTRHAASLQCTDVARDVSANIGDKKRFIDKNRQKLLPNKKFGSNFF